MLRLSDFVMARSTSIYIWSLWSDVLYLKDGNAYKPVLKKILQITSNILFLDKFF